MKKIGKKKYTKALALFVLANKRYMEAVEMADELVDLLNIDDDFIILSPDFDDYIFDNTEVTKQDFKDILEDYEIKVKKK